MRIDCEIIKDLLPLYIDDICSSKSREIVEEHIEQCSSCKMELNLMNDDLSLNHIEENLNEAEAIKNLSKEWKKGMLRSLLKGALTTAIIVLIFFTFIGIKSI